MTGYGRGAAEATRRRATVEIRAVNHRFLDIKIRAGAPDPALEERVGQAIRRYAERGAFTVAIRDEGLLGGTGGLRADLVAARAAAAALEDLRGELGLDGAVTLELVAAQPGVLVPAGGTDQEAVWESLRPAIEAALGELVAMRCREGQTLARDLAARLDRLETLGNEIAGLAATAPEEWQRRLGERIERLVTPGTALDPARLATEVALLADRVDVTEEIVRLRSHLEQARGLLGQDTPVGRKLDFLVQELGREVNTIGSKAQSAPVAARVVEAKAELEKIREQVQNVE